MAITGNNKDFINSNLGSELVGLYYYALDKARVTENGGINSKVFGYVPTIQNITFNPFIDMFNDFLFRCDEINFDTSHFGFEQSQTSPKVYRVSTFTPYTKLIGEFDLKEYFKSFYENDEDFETKLLQYPFRYFLLTDYINPPMLIKLNLVKYSVFTSTKATLEFYVNLALSQSSKYVIYPKNYKGDENGNIEGIVNNNPLQYPVGSSAYASFIATQGNSFNATNSLALLENEKSFSQNNQSLSLDESRNNLNAISGVANSLFGLFTGNIMGGIGGLANTGIDYYFNQKSNEMSRQFNRENYQLKDYQIETMALAKKNDLLSTPRAIKSVGNDATFNIAHARKKVDLIEYGMNYIYEDRIKQYFKRYGYKQNRYGTPNLKSRKFWNFIKFAKCNIDSSKIPSENIEELERIFESGVTFWHVENGVNVKDYSKNNMEV